MIVPGSKATMADLAHLRACGLADQIVALGRAGTPVLGICGGYQMLGQRLLDPLGVESTNPDMPGLGLLPAVTTFQAEKRTRRVQVLVDATIGLFGGLTGARLAGYEIHMGTTVVQGAAPFMIASDDETALPDGCTSPDGLITGTYVHGLFEAVTARSALIAWLAARRGLQLPVAAAVATREEDYDRLAATVRGALHMPLIEALLRTPA